MLGVVTGYLQEPKSFPIVTPQSSASLLKFQIAIVWRFLSVGICYCVLWNSNADFCDPHIWLKPLFWDSHPSASVFCKQCYPILPWLVNKEAGQPVTEQERELLPSQGNQGRRQRKWGIGMGRVQQTPWENSSSRENHQMQASQGFWLGSSKIRLEDLDRVTLLSSCILIAC